MKVTVFTSNQPRHIALIHRLANIADTVYAVQECSTLFPGAVADSIYNKSDVMKRYFERVTGAEQQVFGEVGFTPANVRTLSLKMGDISLTGPDKLKEAMNSDYFIVFGASYIKPPLADELIGKRAVNIHMGVSPYFRGSSCNFWAINDGHPELVGATIHLLSRGLDSGDMLFHAMPAPAAYDPFVLGMKAVEAAQSALCNHIAKGTLRGLRPVTQDKKLEIRYSRYVDFNDEVAEKYLNNLPTPEQIKTKLAAPRSAQPLLNPVFS